MGVNGVKADHSFDYCGCKKKENNFDPPVSGCRGSGGRAAGKENICGALKLSKIKIEKEKELDDYRENVFSHEIHIEKHFFEKIDLGHLPNALYIVSAPALGVL